MYFIFLIVLCSLYGGVLFMNYNSVTDTYNSYMRNKEYYEKNNIDIDDTSSYKITKNNDNTVTIDNPISYYKKKVGQYIYASNPKYTISQMMEASMLFCPLLFGVFGLISATSDSKYKTIKFKTIRISKKDYTISKQCALILGSVSIITISLIIAKIMGYLMFSLLNRGIPISNFKYVLEASKGNFIKYIFGCIVAICFAEIGYTLGTIFRNTLIGTIGIAIYSLFSKNIGKYDLNNALKGLAKTVFDFKGVINISTSIDISTIESFIVIGMVIVICFISSLVIITKRTSFVS